MAQGTRPKLASRMPIGPQSETNWKLLEETGKICGLFSPLNHHQDQSSAHSTSSAAEMLGSGEPRPLSRPCLYLGSVGARGQTMMEEDCGRRTVGEEFAQSEKLGLAPKVLQHLLSSEELSLNVTSFLLCETFCRTPKISQNSGEEGGAQTCVLRTGFFSSQIGRGSRFAVAGKGGGEERTDEGGHVHGVGGGVGLAIVRPEGLFQIWLFVKESPAVGVCVLGSRVSPMIPATFGRTETTHILIF